MSESSSSDEEWFRYGKYTMDEAKKDILKLVPKNQKQWSYVSSSSKASEPFLEDVCQINSKLENMEIASNSSVYFTANDTAQTESNYTEDKPDFLDKLTQVINQPSSVSTSFNTAHDQTQARNSSADVVVVSDSDYENQSFLGANRSISETSNSNDESFLDSSKDGSNESHIICALQNQLEKAETDNLMEPLSLITKNTVIYTIDDSFEESIEECQNSDTDEQFEKQHANKFDEFCCGKNYFSGKEPGLYSSNSEESTVLTDATKDDKKSEISKLLEFKCSRESSLEDISDRFSKVSSDISGHLSESERFQLKTSLHIPVSQCEESNESSSSKSPLLDDTFEEINRILEQGANYDPPEKADNKQEAIPVKSPTLTTCNALNNTTPSPRFVAVKTKKTLTMQKVHPPKVVADPYKSKTTEKSNLYSKIPRTLPIKHNFQMPTKPQTDSQFKCPTKPAKKLFTPNKVGNTALKNVVSPVGIYINHTKKYCPLVKVPQENSPGRSVKKLNQSGSVLTKENNPAISNCQIPPVIYKPASKKISSEIRDVTLPRNIEKLVKPQVVTKHEQRMIKSDPCNESVERRLMESNLSINTSQCNQDISILVHKQPFNLKK